MSEQQTATAELKALLKMEILIKIIAQAIDALQRGQVPMAEKGFASVRKIAEAERTEPLVQLLPMAIFGQSLLAFKQGRHAESQNLHAQAANLLSEKCDAIPLASYHYFMALLLQRQQDYRRALPFWELALENAKQDTDPMLMADVLREIGGLLPHGPERSCCPPLASCVEDPRDMSGTSEALSDTAHPGQCAAQKCAG